MKTSMLFATCTAFAMSLILGSCHKSNNNNSQQPNVSYELIASNTNYALAKTTAGAQMTWTSGVAYPDVIKLEATQNNIQVTFTSKNAAPIDLMAPIAVAFGNFSLPPGTYNDLELKIDLDKNGSIPALQLNGEFTDSTISLPVIFEITQSVELQTEQNNVVISTDSAFTAITTIDLLDLSNGIRPDQLLNAQLTGGTIVISPTSNQDIYHTMLSNLGSQRHHCDFERHEH